MAIGFGASLVAVEPARVEVPFGEYGRCDRFGVRAADRRHCGPVRRVLPDVRLDSRSLMLAVISLYRLPEFVMGPMANPFYHDLGLSKDAVGAVRGSIGLVASLRHRRRRFHRCAIRLFRDAHRSA